MSVCAARFARISGSTDYLESANVVVRMSEEAIKSPLPFNLENKCFALVSGTNDTAAATTANA